MKKIIFDDINFVKELNGKLHKGGVISFVTDTVWGVGCLPDNEKGVENIWTSHAGACIQQYSCRANAKFEIVSPHFSTFSSCYQHCFHNVWTAWRALPSFVARMVRRSLQIG